MTSVRSIRSRLSGLLGDLPFFEQTETRVARYITIAESAGGFPIPQESGISDRHFLDINAPGVVSKIPAVIFFRTSNTGKPTFSVRLNQNNLVHHTFTDAQLRSWHEIIPAGGLLTTGNELTFAVNGDGNVAFSDVLILYTSSETTIKTEPVLTQD